MNVENTQDFKSENKEGDIEIVKKVKNQNNKNLYPLLIAEIENALAELSISVTELEPWNFSCSALKSSYVLIFEIKICKTKFFFKYIFFKYLL